MSRLTGVWMVLVLAASMNRASAGPEWKWGENDEQNMKLSFLGQVFGSYSDDAADKEDIYLRRGRFILSGQIADGIKFFVETDNDNAGKNGAADASTDIQDAFIDLEVLDTDQWVEIGLILLPFSFESRASAASLLGLDYNSETIKFVNTFVWRDYGAELHGHMLNKRVSYCVGAFDGYDSKGSVKNADAALRYTGHVAVNLVGEAETGWFYGQNRLGKAGNYVSLGAGFDIQDKATLIEPPAPAEGLPAGEATVHDSEAWVLDVQSGFAISEDVGVTINGAWYDWDNSSFVGNTAFVESGIMVGKVMVTGKYSLQDPDAGDSLTDYTAGLHYFAKGHNARGGVEYRWGDSDSIVLAGVQFLL